MLLPPLLLCLIAAIYFTGRDWVRKRSALESGDEGIPRVSELSVNLTSTPTPDKQHARLEDDSDLDRDENPLNNAAKSLRSGEALSWRDRNVRTALFLLLLLYLSVLNTVLTMFRLDDDGFLLHAAYLSHIQPRVVLARSMAWVFLALYLVVLPGVLVWLVRVAGTRSSAVADCCCRVRHVMLSSRIRLL